MNKVLIKRGEKIFLKNGYKKKENDVSVTFTDKKDSFEISFFKSNSNIALSTMCTEDTSFLNSDIVNATHLILDGIKENEKCHD